jgi:ribosomal protein L37AE/L43A
MAQQMLGLPDDWLAEFDGDEELNPNNIPKPENEEQDIEVPNDPRNSRRKPTATARWAAGKGGEGQGKGGKGRDGKGKGKDGKGKGGKGRSRNRWRNSPEDEVPVDRSDCTAGLDGEINAHIQCCGCHLYGHVKKKQGVWNCPSCDDDWGAGAGGAAPTAPKAVVDQVGGSWEWTAAAAPAPAPEAVVEQIATVPMAIDADAMFDAMACLDGQEDDGAAAEMRRVYLQKAEENVAKTRMIRLVPRSDARGSVSDQIHRVRSGTTAASSAREPCVVQIVKGLSPADQNFRVHLDGSKEDLDRFATLTEEIQQKATAIALGAPTRGPLEAEPRPPEEDGWVMVQPGKRRSPKKPPARSRNHVRQAASLLASFALLSAAVWAATIATVAVNEGMVPAGTHSWDHGAIQKSRRRRRRHQRSKRSATGTA